jgi:hypothetical protein
MNSIEYLNLEAKIPDFALKRSKLRDLMVSFESKVGRFRARKGKEFSDVFFYDMIHDNNWEDVSTWDVLGWLREFFPHFNLTITIEIDCSKYRPLGWGKVVTLTHKGSCKKCRKRTILRQFIDADTNCRGFRLAEQPLKGFSIGFS